VSADDDLVLLVLPLGERPRRPWGRCVTRGMPGGGRPLPSARRGPL